MNEVILGKYFGETSGVRVVVLCTETGCKGVISVDSSQKKRISAIHIHKNDKGKAGAILLWLGTTPEWEAGVLQNTPLTNSPCCTNKMCNANSPPGTLLISDIAGKGAIPFELNYNIINCNSEKCGASKEFSLNFLNVHGFNFQQIYNGCPTRGVPALDTIDSIQLKTIWENNNLNTSTNNQ